MFMFFVNQIIDLQNQTPLLTTSIPHGIVLLRKKENDFSAVRHFFWFETAKMTKAANIRKADERDGKTTG